MVRTVTDDMVAVLAFAGTKDDVRAQAREFDGLYDRLILGAPFFGVGPEGEGQSCSHDRSFRSLAAVFGLVIN